MAAPPPSLPLMAVLSASILAAAMSGQPQPTGCATRTLLLLSPCLPFISAAPNNLSATVPPACCDAFSLAFNSGSGVCLCYFLRDPQILGFPLNKTKLISLSSFCPLTGVYSEKNSSLKSICSESRTLPPLQISKIPGNQEPDSPASGNTSATRGSPPPPPPPAPSTTTPPSAPSTTTTPSAPSATTPPLEPANKPPPPPSSETAKTKNSSATNECIGLFLPGLALLIFLVHISFKL